MWRAEMPTTDIDPDVYDFLRTQVRDFNETVSQVLRRLLTLPPPQAITTPSVQLAPTPPIADTPLKKFLAEPGFRTLRTITHKYLAILSFVHQQAPERFDAVLTVNGSRRKYFGRSEKEILASGTNTHPKRIPSTNYWAMTNAATRLKREILRRILPILGYSEDDIRAVGDSFTTFNEYMDQYMDRTALPNATP
jgi:negative modulator of initiation of replication